MTVMVLHPVVARFRTWIGIRQSQPGRSCDRSGVRPAQCRAQRHTHFAKSGFGVFQPESWLAEQQPVMLVGPDWAEVRRYRSWANSRHRIPIADLDTHCELLHIECEICGLAANLDVTTIPPFGIGKNFDKSQRSFTHPAGSERGHAHM